MSVSIMNIRESYNQKQKAFDNVRQTLLRFKNPITLILE